MTSDPNTTTLKLRGTSLQITSELSQSNRRHSEYSDRSRGSTHTPSTRCGGFTLIEIVVAAGIFVVVMVLTMGIYGNFSATQRRDISEQKLLEELRLAFEVFNREARTSYGSTYALTDGTGTSLIFRNQNGVCVLYRLGNENQLERGEGIGTSECKENDIVSASFTPVTGPDIEFTTLKFLPTPALAEAGKLKDQGAITIVAEAKTKNGIVAPVALQSTTTSRQVTPYN